MRKSLFVLIILLAGTPTLAETRCIIQVTSGQENMNIVQLCVTSNTGNLKIPVATPILYSAYGPKGQARLHIDPTKVKLKQQGCQAQTQAGPDGTPIISVNATSSQCQVQASYSFAHLHRDYFVLFKNTLNEPVSLQVVTRRTLQYFPQVRPLQPYDFSEEEDTGGAWQYMSLLQPVAPGDQVVIVAARQPDPGFIGGWSWLWGAMALAGLMVLVGWRRCSA